ncbi:glycerophosphodiester phosphodiesterase [Haliscomenobacter sp.]|uniref:glycerophosphodiester phosphodiesterase n=1 Tax=Haliscomenobacter sp. TaxID=2717303 RepID=UPI003593E985
MKNVLEQSSTLSFPFLFTIFLFCCSACHSSKSAVSNTKIQNTFDWQGHRGARGLAPENTLPAFLKALEFPSIQTLELDLAVSADKQVLISHEPWMSAAICSTPAGTAVKAEDESKLLLYQLPYAEIAQYDCGRRGNERFPEQQAMAAHKPLLKEVVQAVQNYCAKNKRSLPSYNIEIKSQPDWDGKRTPPPAEFVKLVLHEIQNLGITNSCCIQSFDPRVLREVRAIAPKMTLALLVENRRGMEANVQELGFTPNIYSPYFALLSAEVVQKAHTMGMQVIPWTVNETSAMQKLIEMGVDGIITDYPNRIPGEVKSEK